MHFNDREQPWIRPLSIVEIYQDVVKNTLWFQNYLPATSWASSTASFPLAKEPEHHLILGRESETPITQSFLTVLGQRAVRTYNENGH